MLFVEKITIDGKDWIAVIDAAEMLEITRQGVYWMINEGRLNHRKMEEGLSKGRIVVSLEDVENVIKLRTLKSNP